MSDILTFAAGFLTASLLAAIYIFRLNNQQLADLHEVKEAGRKRGYAEGYQRKALSAYAPTN